MRLKEHIAHFDFSARMMVAGDVQRDAREKKSRSRREELRSTSANRVPRAEKIVIIFPLACRFFLDTEQA